MPTDPLSIAAIAAVLLLALSWHEAAHAWVADRLGDPTARKLGRVTLNPLKHLDPFFSVILPIGLLITVGVAFGGGKPVPIDPRYFKRQARDFMLVALAGPGSNLLLAGIFGLVFVGCVWTGAIPEGIAGAVFGEGIPYAKRLADQPETMLHEFLFMGVYINVILALFNLMPIPPLDGSRVIGWLLPRFAQRRWYSLDRVGILIVMVFFFALDGFEYLLPIIEGTFAGYDEALAWLADLNPIA